ncbi:MAG: TatD DNase family protein [Gammaproteobacteria bacterium]|jgi:TatD DNase family protein
MFFDSHCHLDRIDLTGFNNDPDNLIHQITEDQVKALVCIGVTLESFESMLQFIQPYPQVFCSVGVHPDYEDVVEPDIATLCNLAKAHDKVVAIGETGLDYFHQQGDLDWQRSRFITHIQAAREVQLPLIVHTRQAKKHTIEILRDYKANEVGGVLHCFTEDWEMASQAIDLGFYISISGIVTFNQAESVREMAKKIPLDRLLIETDSPWLSPVPFRGKTNYPGRVGIVAEKLAEIRAESLEQIASATFKNACQLFELPQLVTN